MASSPPDRSRATVVALLCTAQFVVVLDVTIVAVALPAIREGLGFRVADLQWVVTAYTLVFAGFLVLAGRLADVQGRRRVFMAGLALFSLASLACGLSTSPAALVAARAVQGLGAAAIAPAALATITATVPDGPARRRALGWWTAAAAGGGAAGWVLGGVLTEQLGWQWVFLVNVPVGAVAIALTPAVVPETRVSGASRRLDVPGAIAITAALALLVLGLTRAEAAGPGAPLALGPVAAGLALLAMFARIEARAPDPLLPAALLRADGLVGANLVAATLTATTTASLLLCMLDLQGSQGRSPLETGALFAPFNLAVIAGSLLGSRVPKALGVRGAMAAGLAGVGAGGAWLAVVAAGGAPPLTVLPAFAAMGGGLGVASVASTAAGTAAAGRAREGVASGLLNTAAQVGTALGVAIILSLAAAAGQRVALSASAALAIAAAALVVARPRPRSPCYESS
ncbi:MAG TPA: MFS transporter [Solirubrobacteraceae bacterium]|nr:MFS transporter [Solirubrobacteraceae bacterium]